MKVCYGHVLWSCIKWEIFIEGGIITVLQNIELNSKLH